MPTIAAGLANRHRPSRHRRSAKSAVLIAALLLFALELFPSSSASAPAAPVVASGSLRLGRSEDGRPIVALRSGDPRGTRVLVIGCVHGNEGAGFTVARVRTVVHN